MNTEKLVVVEKSNGNYSNKHLNFEGSKDQAIEFAKTHNFGGGVVFDSGLTPAKTKTVDNSILDITRIYQSKKNPLRFYPTRTFEDGREEIALDEKMGFNLDHYTKIGENNSFIIYDRKKGK